MGWKRRQVVNQVLQGLAATHDVKLVASNNSYYTRQDQSDAHDILLCVKDAATSASPSGTSANVDGSSALGSPTTASILKSPEEMKALFAMCPRQSPTLREHGG